MGFDYFRRGHRLSARDYGETKTEKTQNYRLAEDLRDHTDALLLLTATPHQGDETHSRFRHLPGLLDREIDFGRLQDGQATLWSHAVRNGGKTAIGHTRSAFSELPN